jgi:HD-GYP domain-containing protein (c-di-GMP phosphodiesterase class II)
MRFVQTADLIPGMIVGREVVSREGITLLSENAYLTKTQIDQLFCWGVQFLCINDDVDNEADFMEKYEEVVEAIRKIFENVRQSGQIPIVKIYDLVDHMIKPLINITGILDYLYEVKRHSDYTFQHSVHVAVMTGVFSNWLNYSGEEYKNLVMAGLLHDIGKLGVPLSILDKPGKLLASEFGMIKKHPEDGYNLLKNSTEICQGTKLGVLQHHERIDGSGYPFGVKGCEIHEYAKIVAVADIYDAMTSNRAYRHKLTPFIAMESIEEDMHKKLDTSICLTILTNMRNYFLGIGVLLSNGQKANIVALTSQAWTTPMVRTYDGKFLDLRTENVSVVDMI